VRARRDRRRRRDLLRTAREHSQTENHSEAAAHLAKADRDSVKHLRTLLGMKTKSGYSHTPATTDECKRAGRAAEALLETARRMHATGAT